jgi:putative ubiquitin-RnfH superfamily antitoxin RatB of RatAB toxin-antitoxin module
VYAPDFEPETATLPFALVSIVSKADELFAMPDAQRLEQMKVQVTVYADTDDHRSAMLRTVELAVRNNKLPVYDGATLIDTVSEWKVYSQTELTGNGVEIWRKYVGSISIIITMLDDLNAIR